MKWQKFLLTFLTLKNTPTAAIFATTPTIPVAEAQIPITVYNSAGGEDGNEDDGKVDFIFGKMILLV